MYYRGSEVYRSKLAGGCERLRYPSLARPRVLLVEPKAANQLVSEKALRLCGMPFDLALSVQDAVRMSQNTYGAVLAGSDLGANALISVFSAHRSALPFLIHDMHQPVPDLSERGRAPVQHVFPRPMRKSAVESVLTASKELAPTFAHSGTNKEEFTAEIERVFASAVSGSRTA
jgi:CheY-like chemotaxis protein